jgi:hypothetical protein
VLKSKETRPRESFIVICIWWLVMKLFVDRESPNLAEWIGVVGEGWLVPCESGGGCLACRDMTRWVRRCQNAG